jgi:hypothetical protein
MEIAVRYPDAHADFLARCHTAGQTRPTLLLLQCGEGDFNALHRDLYGEHVFPLQVAIPLSEPEKDFTGGEFVLTEQPSNGRGCSHAPKSCRFDVATGWSSQFTTDPCGARAASTA